jgi:hypothetical protein
MDWRSESTLLELIKQRESQLFKPVSEFSHDRQGSWFFITPLPEDRLTALVECMDLRNELDFVRENPPSFDEPDGHRDCPS